MAQSGVRGPAQSGSARGRGPVPQSGVSGFDRPVRAADGTISGGMIPKLEESFEVMKAGARSVVIVGKLAEGDLVRAVLQPGSVGTVLVPG